jgi:phosphatidylserine decarboxylase
MSLVEHPARAPRPSEPPAGVQPGGGFVIGLEAAWGRLRRRLLRRFRPGYVARMIQKRRGECPGCTHDVVDARDLKWCRNVCGYSFSATDSPFSWRRFGLARAGLAEALLMSLLLGALAVLLGMLGALVHWTFWILLAGVLALWFQLVYFFRDPERLIPTDLTALLSPADGRVTHIEEVDEEDFPGARALRISIFLSVFNVHVNRTPRTARVLGVRYFRGYFLDARHADCARLNEQLWVDLQELDSARFLRVKQMSGAIARRIVCWLKPGDVVQAGERFGMIKFGSRTDVLLPAGEPVEMLVKVGDRVKGGATTLLRFVSERG